MPNYFFTKKAREIPNAYAYLHFLSTFLEGVSEQRNRVKNLLTEIEPLQIELANPNSEKDMRDEFFSKLGALFRELRVFFWWWHSAYLIIWTGEKIRGGGQTTYLVEILGEDFANSIKEFEERVVGFSTVRNDLEHILERIHQGVTNLGNLHSVNAREHWYQFGDKKIDLSSDSLDLVDSLISKISRWLKKP